MSFVNGTSTAVPPGFVVTTVSCNVCKPTGAGAPTVAIAGNGVTATITASPLHAPAVGGNNPAGGAVPPVTAVAPGSGANPAPGADSGADSGAGSGSGSGSAAGSGSGSSSDSNSSPAGDMSTSASSPGSMGGMGSNGTSSNPPIAFVAGAPSVKRISTVISGLALVAAPFFILQGAV